MHGRPQRAQRHEQTCWRWPWAVSPARGRPFRESRFPPPIQRHSQKESRMKIILTLLLITLPTIARADDSEGACGTHLKHLGGAVKAYQLIHNNKNPAKLSDLYL